MKDEGGRMKAESLEDSSLGEHAFLSSSLIPHPSSFIL
jgi:hypothetical protein